uniref:dTDP-glucose 4,6-dehydratase/UDP-glucose 4-epimerase n=1 Tax=Candidatus Kentrum sp. FW TaxID=2126338 RepID=A0A450TK57_9GAMM|nr:MAG: dTDP-glucose 4,6-dehydratase/UDP-glucose 4-epimerase [Candidatus Kentron sp. FW]
MSYRILITGSEGLVGRSLRAALEANGADIVGLDLLGMDVERGDVRDAETVRTAIAGCTGIVHLAAVSRVVWAEQDPDECWRTNVGGFRNIIEAAECEARPPWFLFASSREVYGQPDYLPATEDTPLRPVNIYGRSKVEGERILCAARDRGLRTAIVRLSNVYGTTRDHADRVVPAFARAAALGSPLRVDGPDHTFDFTHIDDTCRGLSDLVDLLEGKRDAPPPIHLLTGQPTTLGELAVLAVRLGGTCSPIREAPPRSYDVSRFYGSPARASDLLGWAHRIGLAEGLGRLIEAFKRELGT